jgi:hypothetical protein
VTFCYSALSCTVLLKVSLNSFNRRQFVKIVFGVKTSRTFGSNPTWFLRIRTELGICLEWVTHVNWCLTDLQVR